MSKDFILYMAHIDVTAPDTFVFLGGFPDDNPEKKSLYAEIDGKKTEIDFHENTGIDIRRKYMVYGANISTEIVGKVKLPSDIQDKKKFEIYNGTQTERKTIFLLTNDEIRNYIISLSGNLDEIKEDNAGVLLKGWVACGQDVDFQIFDNEKQLECSVERTYRKDALSLFPELEPSEKLGFEVFVPDKKVGDLKKLVVQDGERYFERELMVPEKSSEKVESIIKKATRYYRENGLKSTCKKIVKKLKRYSQKEAEQPMDAYMKYWLENAPKESELEEQRKTEFAYNPVFSIVIPLYNTPKQFLKELIESVLNQTYQNWQLCLADGSETNALEKYVREYSHGDPRVCYKLLGYNKGISDNTNGAIEMVTGNFVAFSDHDDLLTPDAFFECAKALNEDCEIDCLYTDEDKMDMDGKTLFMPHFKSDFNIDLLCSHNYITHLFVVRKEIVDKVGGLRSEYDGSQDHDMIFRCVEQARKVHHIPKILYHWRCHINSTAMNPESKLYCYESGRKAVQSHWDRIGVPAKVEMARDYGYYITNYQWNKEPKVSIIIPNMNHFEDLKVCVNSIMEKSTYRNFEIIIVENNSTEEEIFRYYDELSQNDQIKIVKYDGDFNYSKINNFGVSQSDGEYILLLNNDTELLKEDSIKQMVDICMRDDVGAVGARLYYADNTIQHAGVILGVGGVANHAFCGFDRGDVGYFFRSVCTQDLSAVTAACLMTSRAAFDSVNGLTEELAVAYNDVDYCLKLREKGQLIVFTPFSEWYHYESKSRGYENTPEKVERLQKESDIFMSRWGDIVEKGDPYYNPNFNHNRADFLIKE